MCFAAAALIYIKALSKISGILKKVNLGHGYF
jgi:hypothetical protein